MRRLGWGASAVLILLAACSSPAPSKVLPDHDIADARPLARSAAAVLLNFSAYDYALVGGINGERIRSVTPDRYATVAKAQADVVSGHTAKVVDALSSTAGPVHDRLVSLSDALTDLSRDALAYADGRDPAALTKVLAGVERGWGQLRELASVLPEDSELRATIDRGTSIRASATAKDRFTITAGPFTTAAEAAEVAKKIGTNASPATTSPFVVRIGPYFDRTAADNASAALQRQQRLTTLVTGDVVYTFARSGSAPDTELWREAERSVDTHGGARKVALSGDASLIATGSDDGYITVFTKEGVLKSLPKFNAGVNQLVFTDDGRFLFGGGQVLVAWVMPAPSDYIGAPMRLAGAAQSAVFVPKTYAFAASSGGTAGLGSGAGIIGGRAPDGVPLGDPFPMDLPGTGGILAASDNGDLFIASQTSGGYEVRVFRVGVEFFPKGVVRVPGNGRAFAVDRSGTYAAAITDQGTYRFQVTAPDPSKTLTRVTTAVRDIQFGADGTLYLLDAQRLVAVGREGDTKWTAPLVDGRRMAVGQRPVVLDGTEQLLAFDAKNGQADSLAPVGQIQDLGVSRDGRWIAVIADARRAVLFKLPSS